MSDNIIDNKPEDIYEPLEAVPASKVKRVIVNRPQNRVDDPTGNFPDRVINDEDVKLFRIAADLRKVDAHFVLLNNSPVEILDDSGQLIGYAHVQIVERNLCASGSIEYASPERLLIESGEDIYLVPFGEIDDGGVRIKKLVLTRYYHPEHDDGMFLVYPEKVD